MNTFKVFTPPKVDLRKLSVNQFVGVFWMVAIIAYTIGYITDNKTLRVICWSIFLLGIMLKVISFFIKKPKRILEGTITFEKESITVNENKYDLSVISKLQFSDHGNYLRKAESFSTDKESWPNGKDISVLLNLTDGSEIIKYFELNHRGQMQDIRPQLVYYHNEGKLHFLNLIDILGIEDYNAIQIFKNSLSEGGDVKSY